VGCLSPLTTLEHDLKKIAGFSDEMMPKINGAGGAIQFGLK
jgi:hypothetical protein